MDVEDAALAGNHDRHARGKWLVVVQRTRQTAAVVAVQQFQIATDRIARISRFSRTRIGGIDEAQSAIGMLGPDRPWRGIGEAAENLGFLGQFLVTQRDFGELAA